MVEKVLPLLVTIRAGYKNHNNVTHLQLHQRLHQLVTGYDKQKLTLTDDDLSSWRTSIDGEVDNNNRRKASELVKQLNDLDKKRVSLISQLFSMVRVQKKSVIGNIAEAAEKVAWVLEPYKGMQNRSAEAKSGYIDGVLMDLKPLNAALTKLNVANVISELKTISEECDKLMKQRHLNESALEKAPLSNHRKDTNAAFALICSKIQSAYHQATDKADKQMIIELVDALNHVLADYATKKKSKRKQHSITQAMAKERVARRIVPLIPAFAASKGYAANDVVFTGRVLNINQIARYELHVKSKDKKLWARVVKGQLVEIKARPNAADKHSKKEGSGTGGKKNNAHNKPSNGANGQHGSAEITPKPDANQGGKDKNKPGTTPQQGSEGGGESGKPSGQGHAEITPKG